MNTLIRPTEMIHNNESSCRPTVSTLLVSQTVVLIVQLKNGKPHVPCCCHGFPLIRHSELRVAPCMLK